MKVPENMKEYYLGRGLLKENETILKTVYALPGETYTVSDQDILLDGKIAGPVSQVDSKGRSLPHIKGDFIVKEGCFLPLATRLPNSFDGRYFGDVSQELIVAKVIPIWVW